MFNNTLYIKHYTSNFNTLTVPCNVNNNALYYLMNKRNHGYNTYIFIVTPLESIMY